MSGHGDAAADRLVRSVEAALGDQTAAQVPAEHRARVDEMYIRQYEEMLAEFNTRERDPQGRMSNYFRPRIS